MVTLSSNMKSKIFLIFFIISLSYINLIGQTPPTLISPTSGSYENSPTFSFTTNSAGCFVIVVSDDPNHCTTNGSGRDWVYSFGYISANTLTSRQIPTSNWNALNNGTIYWHVSCRFTAQCEPPYPYYTNCATITKTCSNPPSSNPTNLSPCGTPIQSTSQQLSWSSVSGATSYKLQYSTNSSFNTYTEKISLSNGYLLNGLSDNTTYYWRVQAGRCSPTVWRTDWSSICSLSVSLPCSVYNVFRNKDSYQKSETATINWSASPSKANNFTLEINKGGGWEDKKNISNSYSTTYALPNQTGTGWKFRVCTSDVDCPSVVCAESNSFDIVNPSCSINITQPSNDGQLVSFMDKIPITWNPTNVNKFNIKYSYDGISNFKGPVTSDFTDRTFNFTFPPADQDYPNFTILVYGVDCTTEAKRTFHLRRSYLKPNEQIGQWEQWLLVMDPVDIITGNYYSSVVDLNIPGKFGVSLDRTYNSLGADSSLSILGYGWNFNFGTKVKKTNNLLTVIKGDGRQYFFYDSLNTIKPQIPNQGELTKTTITYNYKSKYGTSYEFDINSGLMKSVKDRNGNETKFNYNNNDTLLTSIDLPGSRSINLFYSLKSFNNRQSKLLDSISDPANRITRYLYDNYGNLTHFINQRGDTCSYEYDSGHHLIKQIDFNRNAFIVNEFNASGQVTKQTNALGINSTFIYAAYKTTVNNLLGTSEYIYDDFHRILSQKTPLGVTENYKYTDNEDNRNQIKDFKGNDYNYDFTSRGNVNKETNPMYQIHNLSYDSQENLTKISDSLGTINSFQYDNKGLPISSIDGNGDSTFLTFDNYGFLSSSKKVVGKDTVINIFEYNKIGELISSIDPLGKKTNYLYEDNLNRTKIILPDSTNIIYFYNGNGYLTKSINQNNTTQMEYDANNNLTRTITPEGRITRKVYDSTMNLLKYEINAYGDTTEYIRDAMGRLKEIKDPIKRSFKYEYDNNGNIIKKENPNCTTCGSVTNIYYNSINQDTLTVGPVSDSIKKYFDIRGNVTKVINSLGDSVLNDYDGNGRLIETINPDSIVTFYSHNENGQIDTILYADNTKETITYRKDGSIDSTINIDGKVTHFEYYNTTGLLKRTIDYQMNYVINNYDTYYNTTSIINSIGDSARMTYNKEHQLLTITDPNNNTIRKEYDILGRDSLLIDARKNNTLFSYDKVSRLKNIIDRNSNITSYRYKDNDKIDSIIYPERNRIVTGFLYDSAYRTTYTPDPPTWYYYNQNSSLCKVVNASNDTTNLVYRKDGKIKYKIYPNQDTVSYIYSRAGLDSIIQDKYGMIKYIYNNKRQLTYLISTNPKDGSVLDTIQYGYSGFLRDKMILPNKDTCKYLYDYRNRLSKISFKGLDFNYEYDTLSRVTSLRYPNKITSSYFYSKGRLDSIKFLDSNYLSFMSYEYYFDENNNIIQIIKSQPHKLSAINLIDSIDYGNSDTVFLCSNGSFDTWLPVVSYASILKKPILFTNPISLEYNPEIKVKLSGILSGTNKNVVLLGGPETISDEVEAQLKSMNINTSRIVGINRYDLSAIISQKVGTPSSGKYQKKAILTTVNDPYNSISLSSFAGLNSIPIIFTSSDSLSNEALTALTNLQIDSVLIIGNLNENILSKLKNNGIEIQQKFNGTYEENSAAVFNSMQNFKGKIYLTEKKDFRKIASLTSILIKNGDYVLLADSSDNYPSLLNKIIVDNFVMDTINILKNGIIKQTTLTALMQNYIGKEIDTLNYQYDYMDQLISERSKKGLNKNYTYDKNYNRINCTVPLQQTIECNYDTLTDWLLQSGSAKFTSDGTGNVLSKIKPGDSLYFYYDKRGRLDSIYSNIKGSSKFVYDALNRRVGTIYNQDTTYTLFGSDLDAVMDSKPNGQFAEYVSGFGIDDILGSINNQSSIFFLKDHIGTNTCIMDLSGNFIQRNEFDAFGVQMNQDTLITRYTYTGREAEPIAGLYFYRARWYDAETGRFLSIDPIKGSINDPMSMNKYVYVRNNGVVLKDAKGKNPLLGILVILLLMGPQMPQNNSSTSENNFVGDYPEEVISNALPDNLGNLKNQYDIGIGNNEGKACNSVGTVAGIGSYPLWEFTGASVCAYSGFALGNDLACATGVGCLSVLDDWTIPVCGLFIGSLGSLATKYHSENACESTYRSWTSYKTDYISYDLNSIQNEQSYSFCLEQCQKSLTSQSRSNSNGIPTECSDRCNMFNSNKNSNYFKFPLLYQQPKINKPYNEK